MQLLQKSIQQSLTHFFEEDDLARNAHYIQSLPSEEVNCHLKIKSDMLLCGLPFFMEVFNFLGASPDIEMASYEGKFFTQKENKVISFKLPFGVALTGERIALNLLQRASSIATTTYHLKAQLEGSNIELLDTRKTTPGLRFLEKYATRQGGASNHRFGQSDVWMIKDNHKSFFGGLEKAYQFFRKQKTFYNPIVAEVHDLEEINICQRLGIKHLLLDNFSPETIQEAIKMKSKEMTYEVSGGIDSHNISRYKIVGIDAISVGALTHSPKTVDLSLKFPVSL